MKKLFVIALSVLLAAGTVCADVKEAKEIAKERKEIAKLSRAELNEKASKDARKEAKRLKKEGWQVTPGALPLDKQLDKSYQMQFEYDSNAYPKYLFADAKSIGENYDGAKIQALELAKQNLAGQIQTEITALVENTIANQQDEDVNTVVKSLLVSKNLIIQSIDRVITVVEAYREKSNKQVEVLVRIAYSGDMAKSAAKKAIKEDLEKKGQELHNQLDKVLGF